MSIPLKRTAAQAIADQMLITLTEAAMGTAQLHGGSVWVEPEIEVLDA